MSLDILTLIMALVVLFIFMGLMIQTALRVIVRRYKKKQDD